MDGKRRRLLHSGFELAILFKFIDGIFELIGGLALVLIAPRDLKEFIWSISWHELSGDPRDLVANLLHGLAEHLSVGSQTFGAVYLLSHGAIKIALVVSLWKGKLWSFPAAIVFFVLFIIYQLYRYGHTHSIWLILLSVLDVLVVLLTWTEYRNLKRNRVG